MKVLLLLIICLLAAGLAVLLYALRALTRRDAASHRGAGAPGAPDADEMTLRDIAGILENLEKRVDVLETLLDRHAGSRSGAGTTPSPHDDIPRRNTSERG